MGVERAFEFLQAVAAASLVTRIVAVKLVHRFQAITLWLSLTAAFEFSLFLLKPSSPVYFWIYMARVPVLCLFDILAVRELTGVVLRDFPGISSVGRWAIYVGTGVAVSLSLSAAVYFPRSGHRNSEHLFYAEVIERSVVFSLAVVIASLAYCLSRYPLRLGRNIVVSSFAFVALFLSDALRLLIDSLQAWLFDHSLDLLETLFTVVCLILWTALLRKEPALAPEPAPLDLDDRQILEELTSLNRLLTRAARNS